MKLPLIYIAGPFRGPTPYDTKCNADRAEALGLEVAKLGGFPIIPHNLTRNFDKQLTDEFWIQGHLRLMHACDAMVLTPDWERSKGTITERNDFNGLIFDTRGPTWRTFLSAFIEKFTAGVKQPL